MINSLSKLRNQRNLQKHYWNFTPAEKQCDRWHANHTGDLGLPARQNGVPTVSAGVQPSLVRLPPGTVCVPPVTVGVPAGMICVPPGTVRVPPDIVCVPPGMACSLSGPYSRVK